MRVPGIPDRKAQFNQKLAETTAAEAAQLAGMPGPLPRQETAASLDSIRSMLRVISEKLVNQERQMSALKAQPDATPQTAIRASAQAALTIAELRERLRAITSPPDGTAPDGTVPDEDPARFSWVIERLDEALDQLKVVEFADAGPVDPARNHVVGRLPASSAHPAGTIASSARSGLLLHGEVLRPQQVVIYVEPAK